MDDYPGDEDEDLPEPEVPANRLSWPVAIVTLAVLAGLAALIYKILTTDTDLGLTPMHPAHAESLALIRANERIVQLVQWTISTILVVAGGLLGLNWYQNQKRYQDDKAELLAFRRRMERRSRNDRESYRTFRSEMEERIRRTERAQEQLAEHHRSHLLVQAVDELGRTTTVQEAFATIMSWYGQIREADNARQERALSLLWQGFEYIEELVVEEGLEPVFYSREPGARERFLQFLDDVESIYPELEDFTNIFRSAAG